MWPFLVRNVMFALHERLLGRPTLYFLRELERSQWLAPAEIRALQARKLRSLFVHAHQNVAFYRARFAEAGVNPSTEEPFRVLVRLPFFEKSDLRRPWRELTWANPPGGLFPHCTGGSTGEPIQFYVDRRRQAYDQAARIRSHRWFNVDFGERELFLWGSPIEFRRTDRVKRLRDLVFNQKLLDAFNMSTDRMDNFLDQWERWQPRCAFGYPSSFELLVEYARRQRRRIRSRKLRALFVTGEVCYPRQRESLESYFGVPVVNNYGSRDAGFIAHECPSGRMHLTAENVWVEIIRNDQPVADGETGEIVVTHLDAYGMPFIRYKTGDQGRLVSGRCECGRGLPLMDVIQGRTTDFLYMPNGTTKHALSIIYPLRGIAGLRRFRVTQRLDYSVDIQVVPDGDGAELSARVIDAVRPVFDYTVDVRVETVSSIPPGRSGKHRYVESLIQGTVRKPEEGIACRG